MSQSLFDFQRLAEQQFSAQDERFVSTLRQVTDAKWLAAFADRWSRDPRPWARAQQFAYLALPLDAPGHQPVVKRLFKFAEQAGDDGMMAAFLVAFDRLVRRERKTRHRYDWQTRQSWEEETLALPRNAISASKTYRNPRTGATVEVPQRVPPGGGRLFRYRTRYYLRRRAWRYFRRMGFQRPQDYVSAVAPALMLYRDEDLSRAEHVLESWGLVQACFGRHDALAIGEHRITLQEGRLFSELTPTPRFPELWQEPTAFSRLQMLVAFAQSRLVRVWAMALVKQFHAQPLAELPVESLLALLESTDSEVQQFGVELLQLCPRLAELPLIHWLRLLQVKNPTVLETIAELMRQHVRPEQLSLAECIGLASAAAAPVARLGLTFFKARPITTAADRAAVAELARARCSAHGAEIAEWALSIVGSAAQYDREAVTAFFDSLVPEIRAGAWQWLAAADLNDPGLFARLIETPFDDVRLRLVDRLQQRASLPGASVHDLTPLWSSVLLGVARGSRQKLKATAQLAAAIEKQPQEADNLLPVLVVALRSVRRPEMRAGLAAIVQLVERRPELAEQIARQIPELRLVEESV